MEKKKKKGVISCGIMDWLINLKMIEIFGDIYGGVFYFKNMWSFGVFVLKLKVYIYYNNKFIYWWYKN